ncbi:proteasome regulatory particle base subunit, partial [Nowakowskiella sp. JEL0078]
GIVFPYPEEQVQTKQQSVKFYGNVYVSSPYKIETLKTIVKVKTDINGATKFDSKSTDKLVYGPYQDLEPFQNAPLSVHYVDNRPILKFKTLHRHLEVSHWGNNLWVQEDYQLFHNGAKLKGHFSRLDYQFTASAHHNTNVLKELKFTLPRKASEVYYKDQIGNVSTSRFRNERTKSVLELKPRYPLYGGWQYTWFHGFYVPLSDYLKYSRAENTYLLRVPFVSSLPDVPIEKVFLRVVLPEGASDIQVKTPFTVDKQEQTLHFTYFDVSGRPTVVFEKNNVVDEHSLPIYVTYKFESINLIKKPLVVVAFLIVFFLLSMVYARLDISIIKDQAVERDALLRTYRTKVSVIIKQSSIIFQNLDSIFSEFKAKQQLEQFKSKRQDIEQEVAAVEKQLSEIEKVFDFGKDASVTTPLLKIQQQSEKAFVKNVRDVMKFLTTKLNKQKSMQNDVVTFLMDSQNGDIDEKRKTALTASLAKAETEIEELDKNLKKISVELNK